MKLYASLLTIPCLWIVASVQAAPEKEKPTPPQASHKKGFYIGIDFGFNRGFAIKAFGADNDTATAYDRYIYPTAGEDPDPGDSWKGFFREGNTGWLGAFQIGYRFKTSPIDKLFFRAELDHVQFKNEYDERIILSGSFANPALVAKLGSEIAESARTLTGIRGQVLLANLLMDFNIPQTPWTSYIGCGIGYAKIDIDMEGHSTRKKVTDNPATPNHDESLRAYRSTIFYPRYKDTVLAAQALVGFYYPFKERVSIGLKLRYLWLDDIKDSNPYIQLRSHPSDTDPNDSSSAVELETTFKNVDFLSLSVDLSYHF